MLSERSNAKHHYKRIKNWRYQYRLTLGTKLINLFILRKMLISKKMKIKKCENKFQSSIITTTRMISIKK